MQATTVVHHRWSDIAPEQINPSIERQFITADRVTIARFELSAVVSCRGTHGTSRSAWS